jgi:YesN/AraC family two-component response regulator
MGIDDNGHFIYLSNDTTKAYLATKIRADYFIAKPIDKEELIDILKEIRREVQDDTIVIKIASGERRVRANMLNYVNIEKRCLCYHLKDGSMFDG